MDPRVVATLASGEGLITRAQALDLGLSPLRIRHLLAQKEWVALRRGVYADGATWRALDPWRAQPLMRARAATLTMTRSWVLSHDSAAHALGLDILAPQHPFVHITRPGFTGAWTKAGVKHHLARFRPEQAVEASGLPTLEVARTVCDLAREHGLQAGTVAVDAALRGGVTRGAMRAAAEVMVSWPGKTAVDAAIDLGDPGAESVAETLGRELVAELALGTPETKFPVRTQSGVFWCDLRVGNHIFEVDGRAKYRPVEQGGLAVVPGDQVLWDEKQRQREICAEGLGMSRIVWADFWGERRELAKKRLRAEVEVTRSRFGPDLSERLATSAVEIRAGQSRSDRRGA